MDRHRQLADPAGQDALDVVLPQREPVVVPGGKVADVQADPGEARDLRPLPLREEAIGDAALTLLQVWNDPDCSRHGPFFGWLRSRLAPYPATLNLKASLRLWDDIMPAIDLEPTDHPLAVEQRRGISVARVAEIAEKLMAHR